MTRDELLDAMAEVIRNLLAFGSRYNPSAKTILYAYEQLQKQGGKR